MARFRSFGSRQIHKEPSFFGTTTIALIQRVSCVTGIIIPWVTKLSRVSFSRSLSATGTRHGLCWMGMVSLLRCMWYLPSSFPTPWQKTFGCCVISCSFDVYSWASNINTAAFIVSGLCISSLSKYDISFTPRHAFLPSKVQILVASTSLQSNLHLNSPCQTCTITLPTTKSVSPPYAVIVVSTTITWAKLPSYVAFL